MLPVSNYVIAQKISDEYIILSDDLKNHEVEYDGQTFFVKDGKITSQIYNIDERLKRISKTKLNELLNSYYLVLSDRNNGYYLTLRDRAKAIDFMPIGFGIGVAAAGFPIAGFAIALIAGMNLRKK